MIIFLPAKTLFLIFPVHILLQFNFLLTSLRNNHLGLQFGLLNRASKTTFLSFPSLANWSISGLRNDSTFCAHSTLIYMHIHIRNIYIYMYILGHVVKNG